MPRFLRPLGACAVLIGALHPLRAQATDPLWAQAQAYVQGLNRLVATEIVTHTEIFDGDGKNQDTLDKVARLSGWKDGEPVRTLVKVSETQKTALSDEKHDPGTANHPDRALADIRSATRKGEAFLDAKACVLFQIAGKKKEKYAFTGTVWIEKATGMPVKAEYVMDTSDIPMTKAVTNTITFARSSDGRWMPRTITIDSLMSIMFMKIKMNSRMVLEGWVARP